MPIKRTTIVGAVTGGGLATILIFLDRIGPFSPDANAFVDRLTFKLCPLYALGFTNVVSSYWALALVTVLGNAVLYALLFGFVAALAVIFRRATRSPKMP